jgi:hypothetical protein
MESVMPGMEAWLLLLAALIGIAPLGCRPIKGADHKNLSADLGRTRA